jgi:hypothetical protein
VEFPAISHISLSGTTGGFTSMIDSTAVGGMEMRPGVYDASYSSRLSSVIEIRTRQLDEEPEERILSLGISGMGGLYQRELPGSRHFLFAAHRSILNLFTNNIGIDGVPIYTNAMERLDWAPGSRDSLTLLSLGGADSVNITPCPGDPGVTSVYQTQYSGWRGTAALTWKHTFDAKLASDFVAEYSPTQQNIAQQEQIGYVTMNHLGTCAPAKLVTSYVENSRNTQPRLNYTVRAALSGWLFSAGGSASLQMLHASVAQPIGQLSPFSSSTAATDAVSFHPHLAAGQEAAFLQAESVSGTRWNLMTGVRVEGFAIDGSYAFEPRASLQYRLNGHQTVHVSWNESAQLPPVMDLVSYPVNRHLPPIKDRQTAVGARLWQGPWGTLDAEAYTKQYWHEPVSTEFPQLMLFNMVDTLGQAFVWLPLTGTGTASSRGLEAVLRAHWRSRADLLLSATRSQSQYRALDGVRRNGNYDTPIAVNSLIGVHLPRQIVLNGRESFSSGPVYCPYDMADSLAQGRGIYDVSLINSARGPLYNRLDIELERSFNFRTGGLVVHAGAENVLNRGNLLGYLWMPSCKPGTRCPDNQPIQKIDQMGRFPVFSARYSF